MTPETKTPRDEALTAFTDWLNSGDEADIALAYHAETIISALATDAPIVEGLDEALKWAGGFDMLTGEQMAHFLKLYKAARLYAQGRTQSAREGWKLVPIKPTGKILESIHEATPEIPSGHDKIQQCHEIYQAMLSAAPPVTGVAFKIGDRVTKTKGSQWTGHVVGFYSTDLTPEGYAVESETEKGSVQIYPAAALRSAPPSSAAHGTV